MANSRKRSLPAVDVDIETKKKCIKLATVWIVKNGRSFNIIADSGLKNLAQFFISLGAKLGENINIESLLPHPTSISRNIGALYDFHFNELKSEIQEHKKYGYSITSDIWTDDFFKESNISLTMHYVKEGTLKNRLLAVKSMGRVQYESRFQRTEHITLCKPLGPQCDCKVENEVSELLDLVNRCSKLIKYFKKSGQNTILTTTLKSYCPTRWNTIFNLFKSVELNWMAISQILMGKKKYLEFKILI
uniref:Transposable element Hobo transposase n=1 Tax=Zeugodacus cucurbitae TaxID=28588 RepID=A0A0A1XIJ5_ZEUCU